MSDQQTLPLPKKREEVPIAVVHSCKNLISAVWLMIVSSGYDDDQVGHALNYSPSHWSEILNGKKNLPFTKLDEAMDFCQSDIPLIWWNNHRGYEQPRLKQSELEKENELLRQQLAAVSLVLKGALK